MKPQSSRIFRLAVIVLIPMVLSQAIAQQPTHYKLQPHKVQWAQQVMKEAIQKKDPALLAEAYYLFGKTYEAAGDFRTAANFYLKSLKIQEKRGDSYELVRLYVYLYNLNTFTVYNYQVAKRYSSLAINTAKRVGTIKALLRASSTLQSFYTIDWTLGQKNSKYPKPNYDSLFIVLKEIEVLALKSGDEMEIAGANIGLGHEFLRRRDRKCIPYFNEGIKILKKKQKPRELFIGLTSLANAYILLGQPDKGYQALQEAEQIRKTLPAHQEVFQTNNFLESIYISYYKAKKEWKKAFEHQTKWGELERSKYIADREGALSRLSFEHEIENKETQLKTQKRELAANAENLHSQRLFISVILVLLIISIGIGIAFYRLFRKNHRISLHNAQLVKEQNHRVKNNLQVVSSLLSLHSNRLTDEYARQAVSESQLRVETMAILHRKLYDGDKLIVVNMRDFIEELVVGVLQTYGFIDVETEFDLDTIELKPNHALSVGLIINELCTNASKYALSETEEPMISISFKQHNNKFHLTFADNGPGFDFEQTKQHKSFGLKLIQMQVEQLYGTCEFRKDHGTVFQMQFKTGK